MMWSTVWASVTAIAAVLALFAASYYAYLTKKLVEGQREHQYLDGLPVLSIARHENVSVVTNVGRGPAINIRLTTEDGVVQFSVGALGVGGTESFVKLPALTQPRFLYYQDLWSRWHATRFLAPSFEDGPSAFEMHYRLTFLQNLSREEIPESVLKTLETRSTLGVLNNERI